MAINEEAILNQRGPQWRRLEELTKKAGQSFKRLSDRELEEFVRLYRQTSADLAYLTTHSSNQSIVWYLNEIVAMAYSQLYREPYKPWREKILEALKIAAETVRRRRWSIYFSIALFFAAMLTAGGLMQYSSEYRQFYVPAAYEGNFDSWKSGQHVAREGGEGVLMTAFYATNNPFVDIVNHAYSVVSFGVYTVVIVWQNGTILGALSQDMASVGKLDFLIISISPHGVSEMGGLFMSSAGGFILGWALIMPGRRSRAEALRIAGKDAFVLIILALLMTFIAAPIEGFLSFDPAVPDAVKIGIALSTLAGWLVYFVSYGRDRDSVQSAEHLSR